MIGKMTHMEGPYSRSRGQNIWLPGSALLRALVSPPAGRMCHAYRRLGRALSLLRTAEPGDGACILIWWF